MKLFWLLIVSAAIVGCSAVPAGKSFPLQETNPMSVRECRPVGKYPGPYGYRFWGPPPVLSDFKYRTAMKAREAGATHIYWREDVRGYYGETRVTGYAFDCTGVAMPKYDEDFDYLY